MKYQKAFERAKHSGVLVVPYSARNEFVVETWIRACLFEQRPCMIVLLRDKSALITADIQATGNSFSAEFGTTIRPLLSDLCKQPRGSHRRTFVRLYKYRLHIDGAQRDKLPGHLRTLRSLVYYEAQQYCPTEECLPEVPDGDTDA